MAKPKRGRSTAAIDDHVGARIRERRIMLGLTQQQLAEMIGVTYQQAHKYERGINHVSAGRYPTEFGPVVNRTAWFASDPPATWAKSKSVLAPSRHCTRARASRLPTRVV